MDDSRSATPPDGEPPVASPPDEGLLKPGRHQALIQAVFDATPDVSVLVDGDGVFHAVNAALARRWNLPVERLVGLSAAELLPPDLFESRMVRIRRVLATGETERWTDEREGRWYENILTPVKEEGRPTRLVAFFSRDFTDLKRAEERQRRLEGDMLQAQKLESLGVLAGGIAHDFNNLLTVIAGNLDLAMSTLPAGYPARTFLEQSRQASGRAAALARQMLAYSGKGRMVVEGVDLNRLVEELGQMLGVAIPKRVTFRFEPAADLPAIDADATQMQQVVMNLVLNAAEAIGPAGGTVVVRTRQVTLDRAVLEGAWRNPDLPEGRYVVLEVVDDGSGMDAATLGRIFEPFFTTKVTGRGLGLSAVQGIVRGHRGAIRVESTPGRGTRFEVCFPAGTQEAPAAAPGAVPERPWLGHGLVLVVDDEDSVRCVAARMAEHMGFEVAEAADGAAALDWLKAWTAQDRPGPLVAVILDMTMPRMDGEETLRGILALHPGLPVILTSGYSDLEVTRRFLGHGLAGFLRKPFSLDDLRTALRQTLGG